MTTLLQLNSSIFSSGGQSSQLANEFVATWRANNPDAQIKFVIWLMTRYLIWMPNGFRHFSHSPTPGHLNSRSMLMNRMH